MKLPKGTLTGLMKVLSPLLIWMSLGWFSYPYLIADISEAVEESIAIEEVRTFSFAMALACIILGAIFGILGFRGEQPDESQFRRIKGDLITCPHCHRETYSKPGVLKCRHCDRYL